MELTDPAKLVEHSALFSSTSIRTAQSRRASRTSCSRAIVLAAETMSVRVIGHLIVSAEETFSFRRAGLL
jgi:hypothetical protein